MMQDTNMTSESGRSMTEMLGVLAVIGVLSIGGIQGYTYAMNKYRSNNILNELNMVSHQLATELITNEAEEMTLSLGNPYDTGRISSAEYAFNYGCGNDAETEENCNLDETRYWMSLNSIPENICKSILSISNNLSYLTEQKLNGNTVKDDSVCMDTNNTITFLFDSNNTENLSVPENGENQEDENDAQNKGCPKNTSPEGEGGYVSTIIDEETTTPIKCFCTEINTIYTENGTCETLSGTCSSNKECNRGEYCHITSYSECKRNPSELSGTCKPVADEIIEPNAGPATSFVLGGKNSDMNWWTARNFCDALPGNMRLPTSNELGAKFMTEFDPVYKGKLMPGGWTNTTKPADFCSTWYAYYSGSYPDMWYQVKSAPMMAICLSGTAAEAEELDEANNQPKPTCPAGTGIYSRGEHAVTYYYEPTQEEIICYCNIRHTTFNPETQICEEKYETCTSNADCIAEGKYCHYVEYNMEGNFSTCSPKSGFCLLPTTKNLSVETNLIISADPMDWWSAQNFCAFHNKSMMTFEEAFTYYDTVPEYKKGYYWLIPEKSSCEANHTIFGGHLGSYYKNDPDRIALCH